MANQEENIVVTLGSTLKSGETNALAVASTMEAVATMIEEVHEAFEDNHELLVKARPFSKGSFEIPLDIVLVAVTGASLIQPMSILDILKIIKEYFSIKNQLEGEIPRIEGQNIIIQDNVINVDNITINLMNPNNKANQLVSKALGKLGEDNNIEGMKIINSSTKKEIAKVSKTQFEYYKTVQAIVELPEDQVKHDKVVLIIHSLVLEYSERSNWKFIWNGQKISANITDEVFLSKVQTGESFCAGDTLKVDMQTMQKYDKMYGTHIDAKRTITKVHKHNKRLKQMEIDFKGE
ncbi:MAG: hypothetical protein FVQ80_08515 [Planctomycetes bacterium]|nr:hypothetical protein [Planctomycetota bacterium]